MSSPFEFHSVDARDSDNGSGNCNGVGSGNDGSCGGIRSSDGGCKNYISNDKSGKSGKNCNNSSSRIYLS